MSDPRIVYGARCVWWDSISAASTNASGLPCCPHCRGVLFERPDIEGWWRDVDAFEAKGSPGYRCFIEWLRGKCFVSLVQARLAYEDLTRCRWRKA